MSEREPKIDDYGDHTSGAKFDADWRAWAREELTAARARIAELEGEREHLREWAGASAEAVCLALNECDSARADAARLREVLGKCEWAATDGPFRVCPVCDRAIGTRHLPDCALAAALTDTGADAPEAT